MNPTILEERLIAFSILIISYTNTLSKVYAGKHLSSQIIRSSTSAALNYGEARAGESRRDFIHKLRIVLKELRETQVCLKIIDGAQISKNAVMAQKALKECNELLSILVASIKTLQNPKSKI